SGTYLGGEVSLAFLAGSWSYVAAAGTAPTPDALVELSDPTHVAITFPAAPGGFVVDQASITDAAPEFTVTYQTTIAVFAPQPATATMPATPGTRSITISFPHGVYRVDPASVTDNAPEFVISSTGGTFGNAGLGTAVLGAPVYDLLSQTFTYTVTGGDFVDGAITLDFITGSWSLID